MNLKEIARVIAVPESTVRLYRDEFEEFLPAVGEGRRRRYDDGAVVTLRRIVEWKKSGMAGATIRQELARTSTPQEKRRVVTQEDRMTALLAALESQAGEIAALRAEVGSLRNEVGRLVGVLSADGRGGRTMESIQGDALEKHGALSG